MKLKNINASLNIYDSTYGYGLQSLAQMYAAMEYGINKPSRGLYQGYAEGGVASGPSSGYLATLHGTEAIIPLASGLRTCVKFKSPVTNSSSDPKIIALLERLVAATEAGHTIAIDGKPIAQIADKTITKRIDRGMITDSRRMI